jgi:hypothetical protein
MHGRARTVEQRLQRARAEVLRKTLLREQSLRRAQNDRVTLQRKHTRCHVSKEAATSSHAGMHETRAMT